MRRAAMVCLGLALLAACGDDEEPTQPDGSVPTPDVCEAPLVAGDAGVPRTAFARNVILLMGDGVGPVHWEAARIEAGGALAVDALQGPVPYTTGSLTVGGPTDSAAGATAMATGRCTQNGMLAVTPEGVTLTTVFELARMRGKRTGLVTNTVLLDASPMAFATHVGSRYCEDAIAAELFDVSRPDVLLGGFMPDGVFMGPGIAARARAAGYRVGFSLAELRGGSLDAGSDADEDAGTGSSSGADPGGGRVLGLFGEGPSVPAWPEWEYGLTPEALRDPESAEPTLAELTRFALDELDAGASDGFIAFIENEHPDTVGHVAYQDPLTAALLMPSLVLELDRAVAAALAWVDAHSSFDETLVVVAADHETGGYTLQAEPDEDGGVPLPGFPASPNHTGVQVLLYARGPGADRIADVTHLSDIFHLLTGDVEALPGNGGCPP